MLLSYLKSKASNLSTCKVSCKPEKFLNFGLKRPYLCVLGYNFEKIIVIFEINALECA